MSGGSVIRNDPVFHLHADDQAWVDAAVADIGAVLQAALQRNGSARLLLSGGNTPAPVYRRLSTQPLDWARIEVGLVDERLLAPDAAHSNTRLIRETLLDGPAAAAKFQTMLAAGEPDLQAAVARANASAAPATLAVLGMGPDGHTASLFPHMQGYDAAVHSQDDYLAIDASGCPGAGAFAQRISLSPAGLARAAQRILLVRGEDKRALLQRALAGTNHHEFPIRLALQLPGAPLRIHWCP